MRGLLEIGRLLFHSRVIPLPSLLFFRAYPVARLPYPQTMLARIKLSRVRHANQDSQKDNQKAKDLKKLTDS